MKYAAPHPEKKAAYPRVHLLAAGTLATALSLVLFAYPTQDVAAKRARLSEDTQAKQLGQFDLQALTTSSDPEETLLASDGESLEDSLDQLDLEAEDGNGSDALPHPRALSLNVQSGDTLFGILGQQEIETGELRQLLQQNKAARPLTQLKVGQLIELNLNAAGQIETLSTAVSTLKTLSLHRQDDRLVFSEATATPQTRSQFAQGTINSSLFVAANRAGLDHQLANQLATIFAYDIDFALDIRKGDHFEVLFEEQVFDDKRVGTGKILAARFTNQGKTYTAIRHIRKDGSAGYYSAEGNGLRKAFIRTPVDFARISSRFSNGRRHPILNKIRAHKGVDYAAPHGTPIKSTGDGKIVFAGRKGGYGNTIVIRHGDRYQTLYAHMQGFAKGMRTGRSVEQGQVIGYIGTSGLSTGPHLHYEFRVDGSHVDPLSQKVPKAMPLTGQERHRFLAQAQTMLSQLTPDTRTETQLAMTP